MFELLKDPYPSCTADMMRAPLMLGLTSAPLLVPFLRGYKCFALGAAVEGAGGRELGIYVACLFEWYRDGGEHNNAACLIVVVVVLW